MNISKIANINRAILITGSTGVGKTVLARKIFNESNIFKRSFITLNIASIKEELIESELFGHKKGSFTGAIENKIGYFQKAYGSTLFIDEIGEISLEAQKKLLQVLEEKKFIPVGSTEECIFDGRLIFATNKDLKQEVEKGNFRADLYFRLMTLNIHLPNISNNKDELEKIIKDEFIDAKSEFGNDNLIFSHELSCFLKEYNWPGNRREIKNTMEYFVINFENEELSLKHLPSWINRDCDIKNQSMNSQFILKDYKSSLEAFENFYFNQILNKNHGRVNDTYKEIGISKVTLIQKARKYKINTQMLKAINREVEIQLKVA